MKSLWILSEQHSLEVQKTLDTLLRHLISTNLGDTAESSSPASPVIVSATTARQDQYQSSNVFSFSLLVLSLERDAFAGQRVAFGLSTEVDHNGTSRSLL